MPQSIAQTVGIAALLAACGPTRALAPVQAPVREVAVTFDDLIIGGRDLELARTRSMTQALLRTITAEAIPAVGFVNEAKLCECADKPARIDVLRLWAAAGLELANHTYSHPSLTRTPLADYQRDLVRGEPVTRALMTEHGKTLRYFRHPYLHTGPTLEVRAAFESWLGELGYTVAPVTLDNSDYVFNFIYTDAKTRGDTALMRQVGEAFVAYVDEITAFYEGVELALFERPIRHVLILHANELNADWFDEVVAMMRRRGYRFITLEAALQDPAYREPDRYAGPSGVSWLYRWDFTRGRKQVDWESEPAPPAFVRELYEAAQRGP